MANFGLRKLILVSNKRMDEKFAEQARVFASHGNHLIDAVEYVKTVADLRIKFRLLIGTTAIEGTRKANLTRKNMDVEQCILKLRSRISAEPNRTCIILGRDTTGMTNDELRKCDYNITVRASTTYNTLNVSHAAAIAFFVFSKYLRKVNRSKTRTSTRKQRERAVLLFEQLAQLSDFQKFKSDLLKESISRMFNRADPSLRETYLLMGLASKACSKIRRLTNSSS